MDVHLCQIQFRGFATYQFLAYNTDTYLGEVPTGRNGICVWNDNGRGGNITWNCTCGCFVRLENIYCLPLLLGLLISRKVIVYNVMIFRISANQNYLVWSCDESELCNPRLNPIGDEVIVGSNLISRKTDAWMLFETILQEETNKYSIVEKKW